LDLDELMQRCSTSPDERWDVCSELYNKLLSEAPGSIDLAPYADSFASIWRDIDEQVRPFQKRSGNSWRWAEEYQDPRNEATLVLDILRFVPGEQVTAELRRACTLSDPLLVMNAAVALLCHGQALSPESVELVAASDETRNRWERSLVEFDLRYLYPPEFDDDESFARGRLVEWLIHPTEWECAPDDVELLDKVNDLFVFQFRTRLGYHPASDFGWVAGIAGGDFAFSDYQPAALVDAREHAKRMLAAMPGR
jgi:hypothetical protein